MRFQVPQFIEVEDKIFGPLTLKQFIYLAAGGAVAFMLWRFLNVLLAFFLIIPVVAFALALAFYKVNNKPFIFTVEAAIKYMFGSKLYIWKKTQNKVEKVVGEEVQDSTSFIPKMSNSKLKDMTWNLDVSHNIGTINKK